MRPRWIDDDPQPELLRIGTTVIAKWRPWVYYLVSTVHYETDPEWGSRVEGFITQVVRCNKDGVPRSDDSWKRPLFGREYRTKQEARLGHQQAVALFAGGGAFATYTKGP